MGCATPTNAELGEESLGDRPKPDIERFRARFGAEWFIAQPATASVGPGALSLLLEPKRAWDRPHWTGCSARPIGSRRIVTGSSADIQDGVAKGTEAGTDSSVMQSYIAATLDAVLANTDAAVVTVDAVGLVQYFSVGATRLLGYHRDHVTGASIFELLHPDDVDVATRLFVGRIGYDGADLGHKVRLRHSSGDWVFVDATAALLPDETMGVASLTVTASSLDDNTRHALRRELVIEEYCNQLSADFMESPRSADVLSRLEQSLAEVGLLTGARAVSVFMERSERHMVERLTRWVDPALTVDVDNVTVEFEVDPAVIEATLTAELVTDNLAEAPIWAGSPLFERVPAVGFMSTPFLAGTQRCVLTLAHDIAGLTWSEADTQLARKVASLFGRALHTARTEELLDLTYHEGPIGFSIRTGDGALVDCNQQYLDLLGLTRQEAEAANLSDLVPPEDWTWLSERIEQLNRGEVNRLRHDVRLVKPDLTWRWVRSSAVQLRPSGSSEALMLTSVEDVTENHTQRTELEYTATHDSLTGVATRDAIFATIDRFALANHRMPNLLMIDLDRFKLTNDSLGHVVGDQVLRAVVDRILGQVRDFDMVARLGGDEFAVVVPDSSVEGAHRLAERLRRSMEEPLDVDGRLISQTISIGVALGQDCSTTPELLIRADRAMYVAKAKGRNRQVVFDDSMRDEALAWSAMERELRHAIDHDQLDVYFQPEFSLDDRRILGAEALLRWHHPEKGLMTAGYFIDVAEQSGLIDELGRFALKRACHAFAKVTTSAADDQLMLRVNISGREFARPELPDLVRTALNDSGLPPERLCLEMTETTLMDSAEMALETFTRLHEIGVQFAIDDFGTGYSSLIYLKQFPVDALKIDLRFVEDIATNTDSRAIIESIISLGAALSLQVVAEGIETEEQRRILHDLGCEQGQGYLVSAALSPEDFLAFIAT